MKKLTTAILCTMSLIGLWSCDKTETDIPEKPSEYWEVGPMGEGHISADGETIAPAPFAYRISQGYADDEANRKTDDWESIYIFAESMFLSPLRYNQWSAQACIEYHYTEYWDTEQRLLQSIDIRVSHEPFDTMDLHIDVADGALTPSGDIAEVAEYTQNDGEYHIYEPWQNKDYWFWSEYIDTELTMRLRLRSGQTLEIVYKGEMPTPTLYF